MKKVKFKNFFFLLLNELFNDIWPKTQFLFEHFKMSLNYKKQEH